MVSVADVVSRVAQIQALAERAVAPAAAPPADGFSASLATSAGGEGSDPGLTPLAPLPASPLLAALTPVTVSAWPAAGLARTGDGSQIVAAAASQVGQSEEPSGSNDGAQLAVYRSAVAGAVPGEPWCAYFASWAAGQAGAPLGETGQGFGSVAQIADWAARTGRLLPASATPAPGDLILFGDRHVGIVETVNPDGSLTTIEGNYGNAVSRVQRAPSEATGYVRA